MPQWNADQPPTTGLLVQIKSLRDRIRALSSGEGAEETEGVLQALDRVDQAAHLVVCEHAGMADELLGLYDQLGAVFDITRQLPTVMDEPQVKALFARTMTATYNRHLVAFAQPGAGGWQLESLGGDVARLQGSRWVAEFLDRVAAQEIVVVEPSDGPTRKDGIVEVLAAPVVCHGELIMVALVVRDARGDELRAADMNLADVLCAYCADLIANFRLHHQLRQVSVDLVRSLVATVDQKDPYTSGHSIRVGFYATQLGRDLGLNREELQMLEWSALLHDVGKIGIRDEVLKKPGKLTEEEFAHIKEHPVRSYEVVRRVPQLAGALDGIRHHHERFDGSGYPDGLAGRNIPLQARIVQVADIFDALTSSRSYRTAFDWRKAINIIEDEAGTTVDPELAAVFARFIRGRCEGKSDEAWQALFGEAEAMLLKEPEDAAKKDATEV